MKKLFISIILLFITVLSFGTIYYVSTIGNDSRNGLYPTYTSGSNGPWLTWEKGFNSLSPGDTLYILGGVYPVPYTDGRGVEGDLTGTSDSWIYVLNYPGSGDPILDCSNVTELTAWEDHNGGLAFTGSYFHVKGLTVRNVFQITENNVPADMVYAFTVYSASNAIIENCKSHDSHGKGFYITSCDNTISLNCDAWNHCDSLTHPDHMPGNNGYGWFIEDYGSTTRTVYVKNCRAWNCGDDGFQASITRAYVEFDSCWSFNNGALDGEGNGFKLGWQEVDATNLRRVMANCLSVYNGARGVTTNEGSGYFASTMNVYNNTIYKNGWRGTWSGISIENTSSNDAQELRRIFRNNISAQNSGDNISVNSGALYTHSNNTWDLPVTVTDADFKYIPATRTEAVSLLETGRKSDGSLPDLGDFLKLAEGSDLIDTGVDVGLPYTGSAPDLGFAEYAEVGASTATDILTFTFTEQTGAATINATLHTVSIEVEWDADVTDLTPTITVSSGATIDPLSGVSQDFTSPVVYTVTAEDTVTEQEWTVTVTQESTPSTEIKLLKHGSKMLKKGIKLMK